MHKFRSFHELFSFRVAIYDSCLVGWLHAKEPNSLIATFVTLLVSLSNNLTEIERLFYAAGIATISNHMKFVIALSCHLSNGDVYHVYETLLELRYQVHVV